MPDDFMPGWTVSVGNWDTGNGAHRLFCIACNNRTLHLTTAHGPRVDCVCQVCGRESRRHRDSLYRE